MSWDIFVQDWPVGVASVSEIREDFEPQDIGSRRMISEAIRGLFPNADFADPSWGVIDGDDWSIEVNLGDSETCASFALHVRGGGGAAGAVEAILKSLDLRAVDSQTGEFFVAGPDAQASFLEWKKYCDSVAGSE